MPNKRTVERFLSVMNYACNLPLFSFLILRDQIAVVCFQRNHGYFRFDHGVLAVLLCHSQSCGTARLLQRIHEICAHLTVRHRLEMRVSPCPGISVFPLRQYLKLGYILYT